MQNSTRYTYSCLLNVLQWSPPNDAHRTAEKRCYGQDPSRVRKIAGNQLILIYPSICVVRSRLKELVRATDSLHLLVIGYLLFFLGVTPLFDSS